MAATAGAVIGDNIGYFVGRQLGFPLLLRFGRYLGFTDARIKLGQYLFMRQGAKVVFFGRFVALLRCLAAVLAGVNLLPWSRFLVANARVLRSGQRQSARARIFLAGNSLISSAHCRWQFSSLPRPQPCGGLSTCHETRRRWKWKLSEPCLALSA